MHGMDITLHFCAVYFKFVVVEIVYCHSSDIVTIKHYSKTAKCCYSTFLKIKFPKGEIICRNPIEETFSVPQRNFQ